MTATFSIGYVSVTVPEFDCEGTQRTIDFPYIGSSFYGSPLMHWTAKPYLHQARKVAAAALKSR